MALNGVVTNINLVGGVMLEGLFTMFLCRTLPFFLYANLRHSRINMGENVFVFILYIPILTVGKITLGLIVNVGRNNNA